ncbi:MAG: lactate utilization protein [Methanomicrobiales archaeon]|nr:lactate utilization protein [Methanomicrobiales archaeon]
MANVTQFSAVNLMAEARVDAAKWNRIPFAFDVEETVRAVQNRGIQVMQAENGARALLILTSLIPPGAEVMNGSSTTLIEIGYEELLKSGRAGWKDLHRDITAENDDIKRAELRRKSVAAEYFVSGANAIARTGEIVACDASGSRTGAWPFAAGHLVIVCGINKIVPTLDDALRRIREYAFPLENARAMKAYGTPSQIGKCVILANERTPGRTTLVLVKEALGY